METSTYTVPAWVSIMKSGRVRWPEASRTTGSARATMPAWRQKDRSSWMMLSWRRVAPVRFSRLHEWKWVGVISSLHTHLAGRPGRHGRSVSYTHLRAHETDSYLVCRLLLEKKK